MSVRQIIFLFLVLLCLFGAMNVQPIIANGHDGIQDQLRQQAPVGEGPKDPEIVLLTHVLGGFKGIAVDALWMRAVDLQQKNKFWELYQLYTWMGKLEPGIEEIWDFNAWNMSYNLVAELQDSEARWQWVQRAITWLTDEGLKANPRSARIMERIAWIYWHKIGRDTDLHNYYYKHRLALIMNGIFMDREEQDIPGIVKSPGALKQFLSDTETTKSDPDVVQALAGLPAEDVAKIDRAKDLWDLLVLPADREKERERFTQQLNRSEQEKEKDYPVPEDVVKRVSDAKNAAARKKLTNYTTARILRERFGMKDLEVMAEIEEKFGKFDWRLPEPHALYWARLALLTEPPRNQSRWINYERLILYSLLATMRRGQISYLDPDPNYPMVTAFDLSKIRPIDDLLKEELAKNPVIDPEHPKYRGADSVVDSHVQLLQEAEFTLYFSGYTQEAQKYHMELKELYDKPEPYEDLEHVCVGRVEKLIDEFGTYDRVREFVDSLIVQSCIHLCMNKPYEANKWETLAKRSWQAYSKYTEAQQQKKIRTPEKGISPWKDVVKGDVSQILMGRVASFPPMLIPKLRNIVHAPPNEQLQTGKFDLKDEDIWIEVPPSSPPPK